jgi:hypothetical protein
MTKARPKYHTVSVRDEVFKAFRSTFPVDGIAGKIYPLLLREAIANPEIQELVKAQEPNWQSRERCSIQLGDRTDYDQFLALMGGEGAEKDVNWNSLLLKVFVENTEVRQAIARRLFSY